MAVNFPLSKTSSNLEISLSNRKNVPTENESQSMTGFPDEKPSKILRKRSMTETDIERDTQVTDIQDEQCLQAEKVIKALLSIRDENQNDAAPMNLHSSAPSTVRASESNISSEPVERDHGSNSDDTASSPSVVNEKKKRRRRRTRKRKVQEKDTNELSTTDLEARSTTSVSKSSSSTTCSSSLECAELVKNVERDQLGVELIKGSDSAISQDETYQDLITEEFVLDYEQRMIKENLFIEHEKLAKDVSRFELELNTQLEKSEAMEQSLQELKTNNELLVQEKASLLDDVKTKEKEIASLKEQASSLKMICDELWIWKNESEEKTSYIELDHLKSQLLYKEDELEFAKTQHKSECIELTKSHSLYLSEILTEAQEMNMTLYTALNSGEFRPEIYKTRNVLQLLKQLKEDVLTLSDKSNALEANVKQLRKDIDGQARMITRLTNDKKLLKEEVVQVSIQNKEFVKEKAKLERDKQTLKAEGVRAKSAAQTFKARIEELKASSRSAKRESEIAHREKQNIKAVLKSLGFDYKSLMLNHKGNLNTQNNKQENPKNNFHNLPVKVSEKLQEVVVKQKDESLAPDEGKVKTMKDAKGLDAATNGVPREKACMLDDIFARIKEHGFCLKKILEFKNDSTSIDLHCNCGCYEDQVVMGKVSENFPLLIRCLGSFGKEKISKKKRNEDMNDSNSETHDAATESLGDELETMKAKNRSLKTEQSKQEISLMNYKEMTRGYSHIVEDLEDRVFGAREMRYINGELERYCVVLGQQKFFLNFGLITGVHEEINLIRAMFQRLKGFSANPMNFKTSVPSSEPVPMKSIEEMKKYTTENLANNEYNLSLLKTTLAKKQKEAVEIDIRIEEALFGSAERLSDGSPSRVEEGEVEGPLHMGSNSRVPSENGKGFGNVSTLLSEELLAVVINLVQRKEQLILGIEESLKLEEKLDKLGESYCEYMDVLERNCFSLGENKRNPNATVESKDVKLEKERNESELSFKETRMALLEKQIALLKSEKKACLKALDRFEEAVKTDFTSKRMASALARSLLPPSLLKRPGLKCHLQDESVYIGEKDCVYRGKTFTCGTFGNGEFTMTGSNV